MTASATSDVGDTWTEPDAVGEEALIDSMWRAIALVLVLVGCATTPPMPPSLPLRGQTAETMQQDRADCEQVALNDPAITAATEKGGSQTPSWMIGGPDSASGRLITRQRHASFGLCMESRGYKVEREP